MSTIKELHTEHTAWKSNIQFYKKEMAFFTHLIDGYKNQWENDNTLEMLKAYKQEFNDLEDKMNKQLVSIDFLEKKYAEKIHDDQHDPETAVMNDHWHIRKHVIDAEVALKTLKESLYGLISDVKQEIQ